MEDVGDEPVSALVWHVPDQFLPAGVDRVRPDGDRSRRVRDETGGVLPGVSVELRPAAGSPLVAVTDGQGAFRFERVERRALPGDIHLDQLRERAPGGRRAGVGHRADRSPSCTCR